MVTDSAWYKEVILYNLTCSVTLTISKEEAEIYNKFLLICNHHGKVSAKLIEETYGLDENIAMKVLNILADELQLLEKGILNEETYFIPKKEKFNDKKQLKEEKIYFQAPVRFSLCLYPLIISEKHIYWEKIKDFEPSELMIEKLEKIEHIIQTKDKIKNYIGIPHNYCGFNFSKGIKINGETHGKIIQRDNRFKLYQSNNYFISLISSEHPDYKILKEEIESLKNNRDKLEKKIIREITLNLHLTDFSIEFTENNQDLIISIKEQDIDNIGEIYRIVNNNEGNELSVPVENGWFFKTKLSFKISNLSLNSWINTLKELNILIRDEYLDLINDDLSSILKKIDLIIANVNNDNKEVEFKPSREEIQKNLQIISNYSDDDWFQILFAKFLEKEVNV